MSIANEQLAHKGKVAATHDENDNPFFGPADQKSEPASYESVVRDLESHREMLRTLMLVMACEDDRFTDAERYLTLRVLMTSWGRL